MNVEVEPATGYALGYEDAMRWAADLARSEARWQVEQAMRGVEGASAIADRALSLAQIYDDALGRMVRSRTIPDDFVFHPAATDAARSPLAAPLSASGAESDHGDRREGEGLA